ncbi:MAG TPA: hypothetical protein P5116_04885 [Eubacteriales bacterium]|nr:hypothetical protein [Clostridia bacterium]HRV73194.1 hypothetical protein [Eubacteriales bacterium]
MSGFLMPIILFAAAVYMLYQTYAPKGKFLADICPKEQFKELQPKLTKGLYTAISIMLILCAGSNVMQLLLFNTETSYTFSQNYAMADGTEYTTSDVLSYDEMYAVVEKAGETYESTSSGSLFSCGGSSADSTNGVPVSVYETNYSLKSESWAFLGKDGNAAHQNLNIINYVLLGIAGALIIALLVCNVLMTDKEARAKKQQEATRSSGGTTSGMPSSAFDFDDDKK